MDLKDEIANLVAMIWQCKEMITVVNQKAEQIPSISELASEVIELEKELIIKLTNEIRSLKNV